MMFDLMLMKAIRCMGTEASMAKALGVTRQNVNYWKNHALSIPYRYVLEIERLTNGAVTRYDLAPHEKKLNNYITKKLAPTIEDRVRLAMRIEKELSSAELMHKESGDKKYFRFHRRRKTREAIAKYAGFDGLPEYLQLKNIMIHGAPELLVAVKAGELSLYCAFVISKLPPLMQKDIINRQN